MEKEIVHIAIKNLLETTNINANWVDQTTQKEAFDGLLMFQINGIDYVFKAETKRELRQHHLQQIETTHKNHPDLIIIAEYIYPKIKEQLRAKEITYLEANGNIFLKKKGLYCFIDTNKKLTLHKPKANRAFTKTGLKVLFHFLQDKELVNKNQREIANQTGVGLGNIPQIIKGLKETGYLIKLNKNTFVWENRKQLLQRWIQEFATELKPKILKGNFTTKKNWQDLKFNPKLTAWGGEAAADLLTNHLRPGKLILYTNEVQKDLIKNYKLIPKDNGEIEVFHCFWNIEKDQKTVPPLLVYTDLILEGGKRNIETAQIIYDEHIQPKL